MVNTTIPFLISSVFAIAIKQYIRKYATSESVNLMEIQNNEPLDMLYYLFANPIL